MDDLDFYVSLWGNEQVIRYIGKGTPKTYEQCKKSLESGVSEMCGEKAISLRDSLVIEKYAGTKENLMEAGNSRDYKKIALFYEGVSIEDLMNRTIYKKMVSVFKPEPSFNLKFSYK